MWQKNHSNAFSSGFPGHPPKNGSVFISCLGPQSFWGPGELSQMAGRSLPTKQISSVAMTTSEAQFDPTGLSGTHGVRPAEAWNLFDGFLVLSQAESGGFYHGFCRLFRACHGFWGNFPSFWCIGMVWQHMREGWWSFSEVTQTQQTIPAKRDLCGSSGFVVFPSSQR